MERKKLNKVRIVHRQAGQKLSALITLGLRWSLQCQAWGARTRGAAARGRTATPLRRSTTNRWLPRIIAESSGEKRPQTTMALTISFINPNWKNWNRFETQDIWSIWPKIMNPLSTLFIRKMIAIPFLQSTIRSYLPLPLATLFTYYEEYKPQKEFLRDYSWSTDSSDISTIYVIKNPLEMHNLPSSKPSVDHQFCENISISYVTTALSAAIHCKILRLSNVSVHCREEGCIGLYIPDDQEISRGPTRGSVRPFSHH